MHNSIEHSYKMMKNVWLMRKVIRNCADRFTKLTEGRRLVKLDFTISEEVVTGACLRKTR